MPEKSVELSREQVGEGAEPGRVAIIVGTAERDLSRLMPHSKRIGLRWFFKLIHDCWAMLGLNQRPLLCESVGPCSDYIYFNRLRNQARRDRDCM
jgi:hypothetical protein